MPWAAAIFISSVTRGRRASSSPGTAPGSQHVVDLVGEVRPAGRHHPDVAVGDVGVDLRGGVGQREHDAVGRHRLHQLERQAPGPDTPMNTSAPASASACPPVSPRGLVCLATPAPDRVDPALAAGLEDAVDVDRDDVLDAGGLQQVDDRHPGRADALHHHRRRRGRGPTTLAALISAASTTMAVPCWSSWNTGMSSRWRSLPSISKQRGAAMSSRLMPPKPWRCARRCRRTRRGPARRPGSGRRRRRRRTSAASPCPPSRAGTRAARCRRARAPRSRR
jgi:hypothetical protein